MENKDITTEFFNNFYNLEISYNPGEVDAVIGYFLKRGFDKTAAINTASVLLQQAKIDDLNVQQLIDTLKGVTDVQLSLIVAQILNFNREKTSVLVPDFFISYADKSTKKRVELIEVKPANQAMRERLGNSKHNQAHYVVNQAKWEAARAWCKQKGILFRIVTEDDIFHNGRKR
mgnify:CR=1 FL=1